RHSGSAAVAENIPILNDRSAQGRRLGYSYGSILRAAVSIGNSITIASGANGESACAIVRRGAAGGGYGHRCSSAMTGNSSVLNDSNAQSRRLCNGDGSNF